MMIAIFTNNIQIIVLSSNSYTFLAVGGTKTWRSSTSKKHTFELQDETRLYSTVTSCNVAYSYATALVVQFWVKC